MRILIAPTIIAALVQPAYAQRPAINLWGQKEKDPGLEQYRKQQEEEYNATLKKIPNKEKKSNDPWQALRRDAPSKKKNN
jgi:hypothetical protein